MYFFIQVTHLLLQFLVFCGLRSTCGSGLLSFQNKGDYLVAKKKDQASLVWTAVRSLIFKIRIVKLANVRTECATH